MVLDYIPCDVEAFSNLFMNYNKIKKIPVSKQDEMFFNLLDIRFCKYILPRGKNKNKLCMKKFRCDGIYCSEHMYLNTKCSMSKCENKRRKGHKICTKHFKLKTRIENEDNEYVYFNFYPDIDNFRCYYPKINIYNIKIGNDFPFPKNHFNHESIIKRYKEMPVIHYEPFSIIKLLYKIHNKFKSMITNFIKKYNISFNFLYNIIMLLLNVKDSNNEKIENEIIKKEEMGTGYELTSYGGDINELAHFIDEYKNNSEKCNISNEFKKINILKKDILDLFKNYNIDIGLLKKQLFIFIKDIQNINLNKNLPYKNKYAEIRNEQVILYESISENKVIIINDIKKHNFEKINNINFNNLFEEILLITTFFNNDYIYFENNYQKK